MVKIWLKFHEHTSRWSGVVPCGRPDREMDMRKLITAFRNLVNAPKDVSHNFCGFYSAVLEESVFLGNDAASFVNRFPTFRKDKMPLFLKIRTSQRQARKKKSSKRIVRQEIITKFFHSQNL